MHTQRTPFEDLAARVRSLERRFDQHQGPGRPLKRQLKPQFVEDHGHILEWIPHPGTIHTLQKVYIGKVGDPGLDACYEPEEPTDAHTG